MTITLKPETERAIEEAARRRGVTPEQIVETAVSQDLAQDDPQGVSLRRREAIAAAQGKFAHLPGSTEEFMARKAEEKALEERRWQRANEDGSQ